MQSVNLKLNVEVRNLNKRLEQKDWNFKLWFKKERKKLYNELQQP